jgi:hypothetical protein
MHCSFSTTVLAAFSVLSVASASPIAARDVCGAAPIGTAVQTPLSQPAGISEFLPTCLSEDGPNIPLATAADCAAQCQGNPACLSFLFGLVDGVDKCLLYSVPASSLPPQTNLVAYDIGCASIPSVVPTAANPGGLNISRRQQGAQGATTGAGSPALNPATGSYVFPFDICYNIMLTIQF